MKNLMLLVVLSFILSGCAQSQDCPENINKLPMYGGIKKCPEQIDADNLFLKETDNSGKSRKDAAIHIIGRGWQYMYSHNLDTAMMRFNQAWLLDSLNYQVYWGFGNLLGLQKKYSESLPFFEKSLKLNANDSKVWKDYSTSLGNIFVSTQNVKYLNASIDALKKAVHITPKDASTYAQLTAAYSYFTQKDSAYKYLKLADKIDPQAINPEVRKIIDKK